MILIFGDVHVQSVPNWRFELCERILLKDLQDLIRKYEVETIVFLGDMFEKKDRISNRERGLVEEFVLASERNGVKSFHFLLGNHDVSPDGKNTLSFLNRWTGCVVEDLPSLKRLGDLNVGFLPYGYAPETISSGLDVLFCHHEVRELIDYPSEEAFSLEDFPEAKLIFGGHIHKRGNHGNFFYVGAPYQRDFRDTGVDPAVAILNPKNLEFEFVPIENVVLHEKRTIGSYDDLKTCISELKEKGSKLRLWLTFDDESLARDGAEYVKRELNDSLVGDPIIEVMVPSVSLDEVVRKNESEKEILTRFLTAEGVTDVETYLRVGLSLLSC